MADTGLKQTIDIWIGFLADRQRIRDDTRMAEEQRRTEAQEARSRRHELLQLPASRKRSRSNDASEDEETEGEASTENEEVSIQNERTSSSRTRKRSRRRTEPNDDGSVALVEAVQGIGKEMGNALKAFANMPVNTPNIIIQGYEENQNHFHVLELALRE